MPIFKITNNKLSRVQEKKFKLEKDLQRITEENLLEIFGLEFVAGFLNKQLIIQNFELDTLAFDPELNSFVIIEYKKEKSFSVIDQGFNYLALMLNNKAEFILEYNEKRNKSLKKGDIDWSQSRILFIAPSFTSHQKGSIAFRDLPIELWEVTIYKENLILYNLIKPSEVSESINKVSKNKAVKDITNQVKTYTLEDHLKKANDETKELFNSLQKNIFELDNRIQEKPVSWYIGYKISYQNFCSISIYQNKLRVYVRISKIDDPKNKLKKVPSKYEWGKTPIWYLDINQENELNYAMTIIRQSYEDAPDK